MNVTIHGQNIKVNDALERYAKDKLDRLDRYLPNITDVRMELSRQNTKRGEDLMIAQLTLRHRRGAILRAEEKAPGDIHNVINQTVDKMYRRIQRFKGKRQRKGRERFTATLEELGMAEAIPDVEEYADESDSLIARRKEIPVVAMSETEAIEQMELLGHNFFVFMNGESGKLNVLYQRAAGGYGLLVPQI